MKIDINNLTYIDAKDVPKRQPRPSIWLKLFRNLPKGKAVVFAKREVSRAGLRQALWRCKKQFPNEFEKYHIVQRSKNGKLILYLIHGRVVIDVLKR